jgi:hypothetical protein
MTRRGRTAGPRRRGFVSTQPCAGFPASRPMGVAVLIYGVLIGPRPSVIEAWQRRRYS